MTAPWRPAAEIDAEIPHEFGSNGFADDEPPPIGEPVSNIRRSQASSRAPLRAVNDGGRYPTLGLEDFLAEPEPDVPMLVEALGLPAVGTVIIAGPPKSLKTLMLMQLALCISTLDEYGIALPFLDYPVGRGGRVLFVEEEGGRDPLRRRLNRQRDGLAASATIDFLLFAGVRLDEERSFGRLLATAKYLQPALVVLDPFAFLHGADENKPASMAPIMRRLSQLAGEVRTCVAGIHHVVKPQADRPAGRLGDRIRGASSITAGVDGLYLLDRIGGERAQLRGEFRDHAPVDVTVELDPETLLLHRIELPKAASKVDPDELLAFIVEQERVTAAEVAARFGVSKPTARDALDGLAGVDSFDGQRGTRFYTLGGTGK